MTGGADFVERCKAQSLLLVGADTRGALEEAPLMGIVTGDAGHIGVGVERQGHEASLFVFRKLLEHLRCQFH
jgi:hypothetical protein